MTTHIMELSFSVPGMTCGHCEQAVRDELVKIPGVQTVEIDLATKAVRVTGTALDRAALATAVDEAGFDLVE